MEAMITNQAICLEKADNAFLFDLARAFAAYLYRNCHRRDLSVAVGVGSFERDFEAAQKLDDGLLYDGVDVFDVFEAVAPAMFMATILDEFDCDGSIYVCGKDPVSIKFFDKGGQLDDQQLEELLQIMKSKDWNNGKGGSMTKADLMSLYTEQLKNRLARSLPDTDLHIVVDAQNGAGGFLVSDILAPLGINTSGSRNLERIDERIVSSPITNSDLNSMTNLILEQDADFGILANGDLSELVLLDSDGNPINQDEEEEEFEGDLQQVVVGSILDLISALDQKPKKVPSLKAYLEQVLQDLDNAFEGYQEGNAFVLEDKNPVRLSFTEKDGRLILKVEGEPLPALRRKLFTFLDQYPSIDLEALRP